MTTRWVFLCMQHVQRAFPRIVQADTGDPPVVVIAERSDTFVYVTTCVWLCMCGCAYVCCCGCGCVRVCVFCLLTAMVGWYSTANSVAQSKQTLQDLPSDTQHIVELRQQKRTIDAATAAHIRAVQRLRRPLSAVQHGMPRGDLRAGLATPPSSVVGGSPWQPLPSPPVKAGRTPGGAPPAQGTEGAELVVVLDVGNFDDDDDVDSEVEVDPLVRLRDEEERLENRIKRLRAASKPRDSCDEAYAYKIVKWKWFERFILAVILINTLFLALDSPTLVRAACGGACVRLCC